MFFGYRGQGAISNLTNISQFLTNIGLYISKINRHAFNGLLFIILIAMLGIVIYLKVRKQKINIEKNQYVKYIAIPTLFYSIIVAIASPWIELRYIMPVCGLLFILILYLLYYLISNIVQGKKLDIIMLVICLIIMITPIIFRMEPEEMFLDKREIVNKLTNELNVPTIFMFNSNENRFLDDILLFSVLDESYIAKDVECTDENIQNIIKGKDLSRGLVIFINGGQENDTIMEKITQATGLTSWEWIKGLNACNVYYIK